MPLKLGKPTFVPAERIVSNAELAALNGHTSDDIFKLTGIQNRPIMGPEETAVTMARKVFEASGLSASDLEHVVLTHMGLTDESSQGTMAAIAEDLGLKQWSGLRKACNGFTMAVHEIIDQSLLPDEAPGAILSVETPTRWINLQGDPGASGRFLFADGASLTPLNPTPTQEPLGEVIYHTDLQLDASDTMFDYQTVTPFQTFHEDGPSGPVLMMHGKKVFVQGVRAMTQATRKAFEALSLEGESVLLLPHQANVRMMDTVFARLDIPGLQAHAAMEQTGNVVSCSIPMALASALDAGKIKPGMTVVSPSAGATNTPNYLGSACMALRY
ncbi:MAG TPA: 3-oxoacyl-[acyl-carrier-protein] synthase III C-terminal domain-containing protein [Candidatus Gracilibacteria bacterium]